jgi:hypothetical protein
MAKKQTEDLDDILGEETQDERKAAKSARLKALASPTKGGTVAKAKAAEEEVKPKKKAKEVVDEKPSRAGKTAKGDDAKPEKKAKAKKEKSNGGGEKAARGEGKYYFDPDEKAGVMAKLSKLKKPTTTREYAEANEIESFKVRLAATALRREGKLKLVKEGNTITMQPK